MTQRRLARRAAGQRRQVHEPRAVDLVADVAFLLEHAQLGPHGRVARVPRQVVHHFRGSGALAPVEDVHDLAFAAAENGVERFAHVSFLALCEKTNIAPHGPSSGRFRR
jgi:hypothetical protein